MGPRVLPPQRSLSGTSHCNDIEVQPQRAKLRQVNKTGH